MIIRMVVVLCSQAVQRVYPAHCDRRGGLRELLFVFFSSRRRHTRLQGDWSSDVCSSDLIEETLVLIKPDALERGLAGEIIRRFEAAGLRIHNVRWVSPSLAMVEKHYADLKSKNPRAFDRNTRYLAKKNALALVLAGISAIAKVRMLIGPTEPVTAPPGTIRCDLSSDTIKFADSQDRGLYNLVHAADSTDSAIREIELWFE